MQFKIWVDNRVQLFRRTAFALLAAILAIFPNLPTRAQRAKIKTGDEYWAETHLSKNDLVEILNSSSCYQNRRALLACINALNRMGDRYSLYFNELGSWQAADKSDGETEKSQMEKWEQRLQIMGRQSMRRSLSSDLPRFEFLKRVDELFAQKVSKKEESAVSAAGINGFLSIARDPHTYIMPIAEYEEVIANSETKQDKIGIVFRKIKGKVFIKKIFPGSSADRVGLIRGDEILSVNGRSVEIMTQSQIGEAMRVPVGERISLLVKRKNSERRFEILKTDAMYSSVSSSMLPKPNLGLLTIHKFAKDSCEQARKHLIQLQENHLRGLLVDLRDNPGGQLDEAACIANLFLKKGTLLFETRFLDPARPTEEYVAENNAIYNGPLAVLINSGSASASEILAGALKDRGRASLVGERSFGKGSFQDGRTWAFNSAVALFQTEGMFYFASGWTPQMVGIEPDVTVSMQNAEDREADLYYLPLRANYQNRSRAQNSGRQPTLNQAVTQLRCGFEGGELEDAESKVATIGKAGLGSNELAKNGDDPQISKAEQWLICQSR